MVSLIIRKFHENDAENASLLIRKTLKEINSIDYPSEFIDYLCELYSPERLKNLSKKRLFMVAEEDKKIFGTITLENTYLGVLFIHPEKLNKGIGTLLMNEIEQIARDNNIKKIKLNSSITAKTFYLKLGYKLIQKNVDKHVGVNFLMIKDISQ